MIAQLRGVPVALGANWAVVEVGGVGFKLWCTPALAAGLRLGSETTLTTSLVVREDSLTLYGFASSAERDAFELIQQTSGIGPKIALATLAVLTPQQLASAIRSENLTALTKVPGIGKKGAQKLVIELRDKILGLADPGETEAATPDSSQPAWREQVSQGLQGLGWSARDADAACDRVAPLVEQDQQIALGSLMKAALQSLAKT